MTSLPNDHEELAALIRQEPGYPATKLADVLLAAGYRRASTITEWAAGFKETNAVYSVYGSGDGAKDAARSFVDGMNEVGADMILLCREVPEVAATDWKPEAGK